MLVLDSQLASPHQVVSSPFLLTAQRKDAIAGTVGTLESKHRLFCTCFYTNYGVKLALSPARSTGNPIANKWRLHRQTIVNLVSNRRLAHANIDRLLLRKSLILEVLVTTPIGFGVSAPRIPNTRHDLLVKHHVLHIKRSYETTTVYCSDSHDDRPTKPRVG